MTKTDDRIKELGIIVPEAAKSVANYVGFLKVGDMVFISGQLPAEAGKMKHVGKVGADVSIEDAKDAARTCAINIISQLKAACDGNLDRVKNCVKLGVFINATPEFKDHPAVANGASDIVVDVFGDRGKHTRAAVGVGSLPFGVSVEVDAIFKVE